MQKSIHSPSYQLFLQLLRQTRRSLGVSQEELAEKLGQTQSFISKCERGERRLDVIEVRYFCQALGIDFCEFMQALDQELGSSIEQS